MRVSQSSKDSEISDEPGISNAMWADRLNLEWKMSSMLGLATNFAFLLFLFLLNLNMERPVEAMHDIKLNLEYHFKLAEVLEVNTFQGVYQYLYEFMEASERFDPLDTEKYVGRSYSSGAFNSSETERVYLTKLKRFTAVTATVIRPQMWMTRRNSKPCTGFADQYDRIYSLSRYLRFKYRGGKIEGGWQPLEVDYRRARDVPFMPLSSRLGEGVAPPPISTFSGPDYEGSMLLTCVSDGEYNHTMRNVLATKFHNVRLVSDDRTYFGDFHADKVNVLAYMGYNVYEDTINTTSHPRCFMTSRRDASGEIESELNNQGLVVEIGKKVTVDDVELRCERTASTWHDVQTEMIMATLTLYTPAYEVFTSITVQWKVLLSGKLEPSYDVLSFQDLVKTDRYFTWLSLTIVQIIFGLVQFLLMMRRVQVELREQKAYPRVSEFTMGEKLQIAYGFTLQLGFMSFYIYRLVNESSGNKLWEKIERFLRINPYASEEALTMAMESLNELMVYSDEDRSLRVMGFTLVFLSFVQMNGYMSVHPQLGLIANTLICITSAMLNWLGIFLVIFIILIYLGIWAFGEAVDDFASVESAVIMSFNMAMGNFDFMAKKTDLQHWLDITLLAVWEVAMLGLVFLVLLNFLLAIVVDGYAEIKARNENSSADGVCKDIIHFFHIEIETWRRNRHPGLHHWPSRLAVLDYLVDLPAKVTLEHLTASETLFEKSDKGLDAAKKYFDIYHKELGHHVVEEDTSYVWGPHSWRNLQHILEEQKAAMEAQLRVLDDVKAKLGSQEATLKDLASSPRQPLTSPRSEPYGRNGDKGWATETAQREHSPPNVLRGNKMPSSSAFPRKGATRRPGAVHATI